MAHKWLDAGDAFVKAAELSASNKSQLDAATNYVDASTAYRKADADKAINCLTRAAEIYIEMGRFTIAAKHHLTMAEIYEKDKLDSVEACRHYEQAADFYKGEESNSSARKCLLKVAEICATSDQFDKAARIFEEVSLLCPFVHHFSKAVAKEAFYKIKYFRLVSPLWKISFYVMVQKNIS